MMVLGVLIFIVPTVAAVLNSCQDVYYTNPQSTTGSYRIYNKQQQVYNVWCEFNTNYGYAFVSNLSHVDINIDDLYTDRTRAIVRHITASGVQKEIEVAQLNRYHTTPLSFQYNKHNGYAEPQNHDKLGPYIYFGFLPMSTAGHRNVQGYRAGGADYTFTNCDSNPNSYLALFFNRNNSDPVGYFQKCCPSTLITAWTTHSQPLQKNRYMDPPFYFIFEMHMGGCGGYEISLHQDLRGVIGAAIGFRFDIKDPCAKNPCQHGGTCYPDGRVYTCECPVGISGVLCETVGSFVG
ncbi:uncharacterized protein LOC127705956 [Mytilus californianus]|uniref:uncharacterized protein LOC127705956 n=1 Tax=Mytilus californianus TaxID=6549 RepID=UPI0022456B3A|nr:uncharacterized protein LOC127705956 [Mytilus californianus]